MSIIVCVCLKNFLFMNKQFETVSFHHKLPFFAIHTYIFCALYSFTVC